MSKRRRFEVFKRDSFACQYCGASPPSVVLEVDHIVPIALGGSDDQDNLVTACFGCNRGKAAISLKVVPQSLADKAAEIAEREAQILGHTDALNAKRERLENEVWRVVEHWTGKDTTSQEVFNAIKRFVELLGVHEVLDAVDVALASGLRRKREFLYFCKVCWNKANPR